MRNCPSIARFYLLFEESGEGLRLGVPASRNGVGQKLPAGLRCLSTAYSCLLASQCAVREGRSQASEFSVTERLDSSQEKEKDENWTPG